MPQYKTVVPLLVLLVVLSSAPVSAVDTGLRRQDRQDRRELIESVKQDRQDLKQEAKVTLQQAKSITKTARANVFTQAKKEIVKRLYDNLRRRLVNRYQLLQASKVKIQTRVTKKTAAGLNLAAASAKLTETTAFETAYTSHLAALETVFNGILASENPKDGIKTLNQAAKTVSNDLNQIKKIEVAAIRLIIQAGKSPQATASPTPTQ